MTGQERRRRRSLLVRFGKYEFSATRCNGRRIATLPNGEQGRTVWLPPLVFEFRWGDW